jgi:hypothetical protein
MDPGNPLLAETACFMSVTPANTPGGQRLMVTIRTSTTTLTVLLEKPLAQEWASNINTGCASMSGLIIPGPGPLG